MKVNIPFIWKYINLVYISIYAMNRMKRWLLLLAAVVVILPNAQALKATSLIFGRNSATSNKTTTTTTTTTELPVADDNEEVPSDQLEEEEVTKPPLTGIPQIDYVWDPNLPRELNGFNLSSYPFLNSVPDAEDIDFKCDGLHDGFYASIKFGCQLYHHCIYGIRHDFLCANFTAFDQKTFICHFVSEVNCKNSAKYWFRNDALYRATTTTTTTTTTIAPPPTTTTERQRRPGGRKPMRRRRPQNDYYYEDEEYDDYVVEERVNRRRKPAVRNRHRPVYEDDYPENDRGYEDEEPLDDDYDYEQRTQSRNRNRPANNRRFRNRERNNRRNMNEQRSSSRSQDDEPKSVADVVQPEPTRRYNRDRRPVQDEREKVRERDRNRYVTNNNKRPLSNDDEEDVDIEYERPRSNYDEPEEELPPRRNNFRNSPTEKRVKGRTSPAANRDDFEDPPSPPPRRKNVRDEIREEEPPKVRPSGNGASVFNRPRVAPKISRPVPLTEKQKYDYKKTESAPVTPSEKDEYYDEYEDELPPQKTPSKTEVRPQAQHKTKTVVAPPSRNSRPSVKDETPKEDYIEEEYEDDIVESEPIVKPVAKSESRPIKATGPDQDVTAPMRRNTNDNSDRSSVPSGPSQTEQQQKNRDKFRNSFRSQSRQPIDDTPKEHVPVSLDDRGRNNQKQTSESSRPKTRNNFRYNVKDRPSIIQAPTATDEDFDDAPKEIPQKSPIYVPYKPSTSRLPPTAKDVSPQLNVQPPLIDETSKREKTYKNQQFPASGAGSLNDDIDVRPAVRVVKRPFLPSRGGSPYLPRGLRPVGSSEEETYSVASSKERDDSPAEEHIPPQPTRNVNYDQRQHFPGPLTTQPPQVDPPKDPLEHIYSEYDVTLNDALNPTLKPLVTSRGSPIGFSLNSKYDQQYSYVPLNTATAQSRSSVVQVPYDDRKFKTYVDEYEY